MSIHISVATSPDGVPNFEADFERINVILGANGSGKTKLLQYLTAQAERTFGTEFTPVAIEGGRALNIPIGLAYDRNNGPIYSNPQNAWLQYRSNRRSTLASRINRTFVMLRALEIEEKGRHSDAVAEWARGDRVSPIPERASAPLTRLGELFSEVFPLMRLEVTSADQLYVRKAEASYPVSSMSEGEKQVFVLLAEIAVLTNERSVFLVDEPELNLHPTLAEKLWASIEEAYPNDIFVYATHSLSFALRSGVEAVFAIGHGKIDTSAVNDSIDLRPFLGSLPGIVRSQRCLFVEGEEASFDAPFYRWVLGRQDIDINPVGPSTEVIAAASREGIWRQISHEMRVAGVVDRDFKPERPADSNVLTLDLHEAESYLCHPDVIISIQAALGILEETITREQVIGRLVDMAKKRLPFVVAQRVFFQSHINLRLSVDRAAVAQFPSVGQLRPLIAEAAQREASKAHRIFDTVALDALISGEESRCIGAITTRDPTSLLQLFEGKQALAELAKLAGCPKPLSVLNAAKKHLAIDNFPHLVRLREQLRPLIS